MEIFLLIILILIVIDITKYLVRYFRVCRIFNKTSKENIKINTYKKLSIIIPAMNEVNHVEASLDYFSKLSDYCNVYYVTTAKEKSKATYYTLQKLIANKGITNCFVYNSPNTEGTMATQLNYMAEKLNKEAIIGIYNIDSFPKVESLIYILNNIKEGEVYQQVSYFDDELNGPISSAQNWQNRWSLIYEMAKYSKKSGGLNFVYTIGHGMFIYKSDLDKYGYWSDKEINEDNEMGFRLLTNKVQIKNVPYLERAEFAKNMKIYIKQQSTWFNGPLYAFSYYKKLPKEKKNFSSLLLACLNFKAAVSWLLYPLLFLFVAIAFLFVDPIFALVTLSLEIFYVSFLNLLCKRLLIKYGYIKNKSTTNFIYDIYFFFCHCLGPFKTIGKLIKKQNTISNKYNTEK